MFGKLISTLVVNAVKSTAKSSLKIDELIARLKELCPPNQELQKIIDQKNKLSEALALVQTNLSTLDKIKTTADGIISTVDPIITVIKSIPIPTSAPPGVGVPINVITKLSDTLELLKDLLQQGKVSVKGITEAFSVISSSITKIQSKLNQLDAIILLCASQTEFTGSLASETISDPTVGITSDPAVNAALNAELESRLSPNSPNPLTYKEWTLILETDPNNTFSFPRRRVIAQKPNPDGNGTITLISDFGPPGSDGYSYSSDTQVLINDIQFKIDNPNWRPGSVLNTLGEIQSENEALTAAAASASAALEAENAAAAEEAARQAAEARRGKVIFFGQTGAFSNVPIGNFDGYEAGEYPTLDSSLRPANRADRISSARVGRGLRLTVFKSPNFSLALGQPNTPAGINASYATFEHPLDSEEEYLNVIFDANFNDQIESFIIQKLPGGLVTENLPIPLPSSTDGGKNYVLKRKSVATIMNSDYSWIRTETAYDVYVKTNNTSTTVAPTPQTLNQYRIIRAFNIDDAKERAFSQYNLSDAVWKTSTYPFFENVRYIITSINQVNSFGNRINGGGVGSYFDILDHYKVNYLEEIS